jgi:hypothetical protein
MSIGRLQSGLSQIPVSKSKLVDLVRKSKPAALAERIAILNPRCKRESAFAEAPGRHFAAEHGGEQSHSQIGHMGEMTRSCKFVKREKPKPNLAARLQMAAPAAPEAWKYPCNSNRLYDFQMIVIRLARCRVLHSLNL